MKYKFRRGDKVEVLMKKELPCCTWRCGEIVSGNGHNYDISFYDSLGGGGVAVQRFPRKLMRPFPRLDDAFREWAPGDTAEMFDSMSWKAVSVSDLLGADYYLVRLLGSLQEVRAHKSSLRVQQIWIRDEWVMLGRHKFRGNVQGLRGKRKPCQEDNEADLSDTESVGSNGIDSTSKTTFVSIFDSSDAESRFAWGYSYDMESPLPSKEILNSIFVRLDPDRTHIDGLGDFSEFVGEKIISWRTGPGKMAGVFLS